MALYSSTMLRTEFNSLLESVMALQESHSLLSRKFDKLVSSVAQFDEALSACSKAFSDDELPGMEILTSTLPLCLDTEPTEKAQISITPAMGSHTSSDFVETGIDFTYPNDRHEAVTGFIGNGQLIILGDFRKMLNMELAHLVFDEMLTQDIFYAIGVPNRDIIWNYFIESGMSDVLWVLLRDGLTYTKLLPISVERAIQTSSPKFLVTYVVSPKVFDDLLHSCCPKVCVEAQSKALLKMPNEDAIGPEQSEIQLFNAQQDTLERFVTSPSLDHGSSGNQIEIEPFNDMYLDYLFMESATIAGLCLIKYFMQNEDGIPTGGMPSTKMIHVVKHGTPIGEVEHAEGILLVVSVQQGSFSMNSCSPYKDCSTIVVGDFKDLFHKSACHIANIFIDQRLLNQFPFNPGVTLFIVTVCGVAINLCVWDPEISFEFMAMTGSTFSMEAQTLFEAIRKIWSCLSGKWFNREQLDGFKLDVESIDDIFLDICFAVPNNIEDRHLGIFLMECELEKTMLAYKYELILMFLADIEHHERVIRTINLNYCTETMDAIRETKLPWRKGHLVVRFVLPGDNMVLHLIMTISIKYVLKDTTEVLGDYWTDFYFIGMLRAKSYDGGGRTLFDGSSGLYDYNAFPCPSIAGEEYTLVINEYFEVKHDVLVAEFQHFSVSYHDFSYALSCFAQTMIASDSLCYLSIVIEIEQPLPSRFILVQCDKLNKVRTNNSFAFLESNLEDKVLFGDRSIVVNDIGPKDMSGGIVMNGPGQMLAKQPNTGLSVYVWDPG